MTNVKHALWLMTALIGLAFFSWHSVRSTSLHPKLDEKALAVLPDHQVIQLTIKQFDTAGLLTHQLTTPLMRHVPYQNKHWFKTPLIHIAEPSQPAWDISAQEALAFDGGEHVQLQHNVILHHHIHHEQPEGIIKTEEIDYFPKQKRASTLADIIWNQAGHTVQSTGMNAYLAERRIDLLNHTRVIYAPMQG